MQLRNVTIANFRGIKSAAIKGLTDVSVIVGRNNSGKTSLFEAIEDSIRGLGGGQDLLQRKPGDMWRDKNRVEARSDFYKLDESLTVTVITEICEGDRVVRTLGFSIQGGKRKNSNTTAVEDNDLLTKSLEFAKRFTTIVPIDVRTHGIEDLLFGPLVPQRKDKDITEVLNDVYGINAEQLMMTSDRRLQVMYDDMSLGIDLLGDGAKIGLRTILVLNALTGSLMLLEEPECFQHPGSLRRLAQALCFLAKKNQVQLIVTTHSIDCLDAFRSGAQEAQSDFAVFHLSRTDGVVETRKLDSETLDTLQRDGLDVRQLDLYV